MKKILLVVLSVLLPMSVYALEPMSMDSLDEITAQEGVKITISGSGIYNDGSVDVITDALEIQQKAVSTAWTNKDATGTVESGIVNVVSQTLADKIFVKGDLTILASTTDTTATATDPAVSSVNIGLPDVYITKGSKKTEIYITNRNTNAVDAVNNPNGGKANLDDSNFISDVTYAGAPGKLGTQYTNAGYTHIVKGGKISISALP